MRKIVFVALLIGLFAGTVFAQSAGENSDSGIVSIYMTSFVGSDNPQSFVSVPSFHTNESPWLYLKVKDSVAQVAGTWWYDATGNQGALLKFDTLNLDTKVWAVEKSYNVDDTQNWWITRTDFSEYASHAQEWYVSTDGGDIKYTVTPEPASMLLFALGGGAFLLGRKKKS